MMSSVVPARLEFQCGHAALVSLPRVKGESSAQRSDRIAREKRAAQARSCDFCPPPLTLVDIADAMVAVAAQPEPVVLVAAQPEPVALPVVPVVLPVETPVATRSVAAIRTTKPQARPHRNGTARRNGRAPGYTFVVRFRTEAVVEATDIRDALRQAELLGATDVLALAAIG